MKRTKIIVLIVAMLVLCTALSMGCLEEEEAYTEEFERLNAIEDRTWQEEQRWNELRFEILFPSEGERVDTEVPTPVPLSNRSVAKYNWEWVSCDTIGHFNAPRGYTYAIVTYRVKNDGYNTISTSPNFWKFSANGIVFDHDSKSYSDSINTINVDVYTGGDVTDNIVYLIPDNIDSAAFYYDPWYGDDTIYKDLTLEVEDFEWY